MVAKSRVILAMENAALEAGEEVLQRIRHGENLRVTKKGPGDFVTDADLGAQEILIKQLRNFNSTYGFLIEEEGEIPGDDDRCRWIIDPLDGTTNYIHGLPHFCISIALQLRDPNHKPEIQAGLVYAPALAQMFWAEKGNGAYLNNQPLMVSSRSHLNDALLAGYVSRNPTSATKDIAARSALAANVRIMGSAALELAYVAAGKLDGFWHVNLNAWDMAAGIVLIQESGGCVSEIAGGNQMLENHSILATNAHLHQAIISVLAPFYCNG